jgi:hypothetical protein
VASGVDSRAAAWIVHRSQGVTVAGPLSEETRVTSGALGPLLLLAYVNDVWRNAESTVRLFADDCIIYREMLNNNGMENLQIALNRLGEWAFENEMIINPTKSKASPKSE